MLNEDQQHQAKNDFITLALNESGVVRRHDQDCIKKEGDFEEIASEILSGSADKDPKAVKKRLKWDRRFRVEEANFSKRKREFDEHIEAYKRDFDEAINIFFQYNIFPPPIFVVHTCDCE